MKMNLLKMNLDKTLIVGASVSAAPLEKNPAKRFLRSRGYLGGVTTHAFSGAPGARVLKQLKRSSLDGVTAVIGVDLMFWDSVIGLGDPREGAAFLKGFFNEVKARELPIVIGNIPAFHDLQIHRETLNEVIRKECTSYERACILPLDKLFEDVSLEGVLHEGRRYTLSELLPDGLHPSPVAAEAIALEIAKIVS